MDVRSAIRDAGLRVTRQRVAVFDAVRVRQHVSATVVLAEVAAVLPGVSHQAVYDCLADLTGAGLLRRLTIDGGPMLYETRAHDNHDHFVCRICNTVFDVDTASDTTFRSDVQIADGFVIDEAEVTYRGFCADCAGSRRVTDIAIA